MEPLDSLIAFFSSEIGNAAVNGAIGGIAGSLLNNVLAKLQPVSIFATPQDTPPFTLGFKTPNIPPTHLGPSRLEDPIQSEMIWVDKGPLRIYIHNNTNEEILLVNIKVKKSMYKEQIQSALQYIPQGTGLPTMLAMDLNDSSSRFAEFQESAKDYRLEMVSKDFFSRGKYLSIAPRSTEELVLYLLCSKGAWSVNLTATLNIKSKNRDKPIKIYCRETKRKKAKLFAVASNSCIPQSHIFSAVAGSEDTLTSGLFVSNIDEGLETLFKH